MKHIEEILREATVERLVNCGYDHEHAERLYRMYDGSCQVDDLLEYVDLKEQEIRGLLGGCGDE